MKKVLTHVILFFTAVSFANAQTPSHPFPYSFQFYQKLNKEVYNKDSRIHSALKPYFRDDNLLSRVSDSILSYGVDTNRKTWAARKLYNEHLIDIRNEEFTAYVDFLPDFLVGQDLADDNNTWLNTRGFQVGGTIGRKFSFYTSGYENQGKFPVYYEDYIKSSQIVPGLTYDRGWGKETRDWSYVSAFLSYTPVKYLNITFGQDKTFIGDGYRSILLSDFSSNYPFLRLTGNLGNVQYMAMWTAMQDPTAPKLSYDAGNRKKGGVFHYLDWNVNNRLSLGFFDAIIWSQTDDEGNVRGFDWGYANPIIFLRPVEAMSGSPDNAVVGLNVKYEVFDKTAVYGQFLLDEFEAKNFFGGKASNRNKWGVQAGIRGADLFGAPRLNYLAEFNAARPYLYTARNRMISYSQFAEPLAHPFGANFREFVGKVNYSVGRFDFSGQVNIATYGMDLNRFTHFGKNIFKPYPRAADQVYVGHGVPTDMQFGEVRVAYVINPAYNLRLELGGITRTEANAVRDFKTNWITFGLRSTFRNIYQDLSSY